MGRKVSIRNSKLVDAEQGLFSVLGLVSFRRPGPYWWHGEDINDGESQGAIFRAYVPDQAKAGQLDVAYVLVADATADTTEPDISKLEDADVHAIDCVLHEGIERALTADGMQMVRWMSSHLNKVANLKGLVTAYIVRDQGKERQYMTLRITVKSRKLVVIGVFDIERSADLAAPVFNIMRDMTVAA